MHKWQLQEAKNKLSHLIEVAMDGKPQCITKRGKDAVVILGIKEYKKLQGKDKNFKQMLLEGEKVEEFEVERRQSKMREVDL